MKYLTLLFALLNASLFTGAIQPTKNPVQWTYTGHLKSPSIMELRFQTRIDNGWHVFSPNNTNENSPMSAILTLSQSETSQPIGKLKAIGALKHYESVLGVETELFRNQAVLVQEIKLSKSTKFVSGELSMRLARMEKKCVL